MAEAEHDMAEHGVAERAERAEIRAQRAQLEAELAEAEAMLAHLRRLYARMQLQLVRQSPAHSPTGTEASASST